MSANRHPVLRRNGWGGLLLSALLSALLAASGTGAIAQRPGTTDAASSVSSPVQRDDGTAGRIGGGRPAPQPCVTVEAGTARAGPVDCAAAALRRAARAAQAGAETGNGAGLAVPSALSPGVAVGEASLAGSSQRLGGSLVGATTLPQRHLPSPPPTPPFPTKP